MSKLLFPTFSPHVKLIVMKTRQLPLYFWLVVVSWVVPIVALTEQITQFSHHKDDSGAGAVMSLILFPFILGGTMLLLAGLIGSKNKTHKAKFTALITSIIGSFITGLILYAPLSQ